MITDQHMPSTVRFRWVRLPVIRLLHRGKGWIGSLLFHGVLLAGIVQAVPTTPPAPLPTLTVVLLGGERQPATPPTPAPPSEPVTRTAPQPPLPAEVPEAIATIRPPAPVTEAEDRPPLAASAPPGTAPAPHRPVAEASPAPTPAPPDIVTDAAPPAATRTARPGRSDTGQPPSSGSFEATTPARPTVRAGQNHPPRYPYLARIRALEGKVVLRVRVHPNGRPGRVTVLRTSGHAILDREAVRAVKAWRFDAARQNGIAVSGVVDVPVTFRLNG